MVLKILWIKNEDGTIDQEKVAAVDKSGKVSITIKRTADLDAVMAKYGPHLYLNAVMKKDGLHITGRAAGTW